MRQFDPLAYIESAFLDAPGKGVPGADAPKSAATKAEVTLPDLGSYLAGGFPRERAPRYRRTAMRAPRPRRSHRPPGSASGLALDPDLLRAVQGLPDSIAFLLAEYDDAVTAKSYGGEFKETRRELIRRLLDPVLTLEETSRLLGVCPATVRRYTNRGWLHHRRTGGGQRRFRLSDVVTFVQAHGRTPLQREGS